MRTLVHIAVFVACVALAIYTGDLQKKILRSLNEPESYAALAAETDHRKQLMDGSIHYNEGRAGFLPTGDDKPYLSVTVSENWKNVPLESQVVAWFQTYPRLVNISKQCKFNYYTADNPHFRDRLSPFMGTAFPIVTLQRGGVAADRKLGQVYLNITSAENNFPKSAGELADEIDKAIDAHFSPPTVQSAANVTMIQDENGDCHPNDPNCPFRPRPNEPNKVPVKVIPEIRVRPELGGTLEALAALVVLAMASVAVCAVVVVARSGNQRKSHLL